MKWLGLAILVACVGLNSAETRDADGKMRANVVMGMKFWYNPTDCTCNTTKDEYGGVDEVNPTQICTFAMHRASCQGDSGGPVIWLDPDTNRYTLVRAVSFGGSCGPTVHTAIGHYLDWIENYVRVFKRSKICLKIE